MTVNNNVIAYACFTHREKGLISTGKYTWHQIVLRKQTNISYGKKKQSLLGLINRAGTCTSELRLWGQLLSRLPKILLLLSVKRNFLLCWTSFLKRMRLRKIQTCKSNNPKRNSNSPITYSCRVFHTLLFDMPQRLHLFGCSLYAVSYSEF